MASKLSPSCHPIRVPRGPLSRICSTWLSNRRNGTVLKCLLIRVDPPLCLASVLKSSWVCHLDGSLIIEATGSQVTHTSLKRTHATLTPDAALAVSGLLQSLSRSTTTPGFDVIPTLSTLHQWFTCVRLSVSHLTRSSLAVSVTLTTMALDHSRSRWFAACLRRPAARDQQTLISRAYCLAHNHRHS